MGKKRPPGVFITGHIRSGTSMVAGVFGTQGVFFGECGKGSSRNRKGNWENNRIAQEVKGGKVPGGWPDSWPKHLKREGWDGKTPWGLKLVAVHWHAARLLEPDVVVLTYRDKESILKSTEEFGGGHRYSRLYRDPMVERHWDIMHEIEANYRGLVVSVYTPELVADPSGVLERDLMPAFDRLGMEPDEAALMEWIDVDLWHHRPPDWEGPEDD